MGIGGASGLHERDRELRALDDLVDDAARGRGAVAVLAGPPGIGKTALVRAAVDRARDAGLRVLAVRLGELDEAVAFGVVRDLLAAEVIRLRTTGDAATQRALEVLAPAASAPHPPAASPAEVGSALHALYWVVADLAQAGPLLLAVDDAQWADAASLRFLHHLTRRIEGLPVALLLATRRSAGRADDVLRLADELPPRRVLQPAPLSREAVGARATEHRRGPALDDAAVAGLHAATAGNPLALHQLLDALDHAGLDPATLPPRRVREIGARALAEGVRRRLAHAPPESVALAETLAVVGDLEGDLGDPGLLARVAGIGAGEVATARQHLVGADLVQPGPPLGFAHPLLAEAVRADVAPERRDDLSRRAGRLLTESGHDVAAARQLMQVTPSGDAWVAGVLLRAAGDSTDRGAPDVAAGLLERALAEPPGPDQLGDVLGALGRAQLALGRPEAADTLALALEETPELRAGALVAADLAQAFVDTVRITEAADVLGLAAQRLRSSSASADAALADELELQQLMFATWEPTLHGRIVDHLAARPQRRLTSAYARRLDVLVVATEGVSACRPVAECTALLEEALADDVLFGRSPSVALIAIPLLGACGETRSAREHLTRMLTGARARGALPIVRAAIGLRGQLSMWEGDVLGAEADGWGMQELIEEGELGAPYLLGFLTDALLAQGRVDDAVAALRAAGLWSTPLPDLAPLNAILWARGRALLALGDPHAALDDLLLCGRRQESVGQLNSGLVPWRVAATEALTRLGRHDEAVALADEDVALARSFGAPHTLGAALRARASAADGPPDLDLLVEAAALLEPTTARLELARVRHDTGRALVARDEQEAAREQYAAAAALAEQLHATGLAATAVAGLVAAGGRPRRRPARGAAALTPAERQVADAAATGASNREIARDLFVTEKTVETHLSSCYRKLGVRSRTQLAAALR